MTRSTIGLSDRLDAYIEAVSLRDSDVQRRLREETARYPHGTMLLNPVQGQFMALLVKAIGATRAIEVGTFTGYSALCVALALPPGGTLVACDVDADAAAVARRYWSEAGVDERIDLRLGPAIQTLDALIAQGSAGRFDFAFIDADKANYDAYYERLLRLVRAGGLILMDNVLRSGKVADPEAGGDAIPLRALNEKVGKDERVDATILPVADGLTIVRKR